VKKPPRGKSKNVKSARTQRPPVKAAAAVACNRQPLKPQHATSLQRATLWLATLNEGLHGTPPPRHSRLARSHHRYGAATAPLIEADDRHTFALLSLPILAMIAALALTQSYKPLRPTGEIARNPSTDVARPVDRVRLALRANPVPLEPVSASPPPKAVPGTPVRAIQPNASPAASTGTTDTPLAPTLSPPDARQPVSETSNETNVAMLAPARRDLQMATPPAPSITAREEEVLEDPSVCRSTTTGFGAKPPPLALGPQNQSPSVFGVALARAARAQSTDLVIYNDRYRRIAYPMGDVAPLYGVCTDVIIRAYRAVGIDLQQRVHEAGMSGGDTSIGHRRTETLRRFFTRFGTSLPITTIAEDFRPGDIVTYSRPQNRHSRSHIAIVSDVAAPSGRYMIAHNRGWGVALEDGLFVDEMTGHYRYSGDRMPVPVALTSPPQTGTGPSAERQPRTQRVAVRRTEGTPTRGLGR